MKKHLRIKKAIESRMKSLRRENTNAKAIMEPRILHENYIKLKELNNILVFIKEVL